MKYMIDRIKEYIIACISLLVGGFLPYLYSYADTYSEYAQIIIYSISIGLFLIGLLIIVILQYRQRSHRVKYSVLIFAINSDCKLLTVYNDYHKRIMIPCGIIPSNMTPNLAAHRFISEQTGLRRADYTNVIYTTKRSIDKRKIQPYHTQIEFVTKHENNVRLHYAFIYFLQVKDNVKVLPNVSFRSLKELEEMQQQTSLFSDLRDRYRDLLRELTEEKQYL